MRILNYIWSRTSLLKFQFCWQRGREAAGWSGCMRALVFHLSIEISVRLRLRCIKSCSKLALFLVSNIILLRNRNALGPMGKYHESSFVVFYTLDCAVSVFRFLSLTGEGPFVLREAPGELSDAVADPELAHADGLLGRVPAPHLHRPWGDRGYSCTCLQTKSIPKMIFLIISMTTWNSQKRRRGAGSVGSKCFELGGNRRL